MTSKYEISFLLSVRYGTKLRIFLSFNLLISRLTYFVLIEPRSFFFNASDIYSRIFFYELGTTVFIFISSFSTVNLITVVYTTFWREPAENFQFSSTFTVPPSVGWNILNAPSLSMKYHLSARSGLLLLSACELTWELNRSEQHSLDPTLVM